MDQNAYVSWFNDAIVNKPIIYILLEVYKREYLSRLALSRTLIAMGYIVILGQKDSLLDSLYLGILPAGLVFDKCATISSTQKWQQIFKGGSRLFVLDEEGIHTFYSEVASRLGDPTFVSHYFFNNNYHYLLTKRVCAHRLLEIPSYSISGNPRLLRTQSNFPESISPFFDKSDSVVVLIVGNYYNFSPENKFIEHDICALECVMSFVSKYSKLCSKRYSFFYRPHPVEDETISDFMIVNGVPVIRHGGIDHLINCSDIIITSRCTVSIQAALQHKIVFSFKSLTSSNVFTRVGTIRFFSPQSLYNKLDTLISGSDDSSISLSIKQFRILKFLFAPDTNPLLHISSRIEEFCNSSEYISRNHGFYWSLGIRIFLANILSSLLIRRPYRFMLSNKIDMSFVTSVRLLQKLKFPMISRITK